MAKKKVKVIAKDLKITKNRYMYATEISTRSIDIDNYCDRLLWMGAKKITSEA